MDTKIQSQTVPKLSIVCSLERFSPIEQTQFLKNTQCPAPSLVVVKCLMFCLDLLTTLAYTIMTVNLRL